MINDGVNDADLYPTSDLNKYTPCKCTINNICDIGGCPASISSKCVDPARDVGYWDGCDYGCCTLNTGFTGRKCPSFMNPGGDADYHDTG
jgi:hypothetical protein